MKKFLLYIFTLLLFSNCLLKAEEGFGGKVGLTLQFGTHIQRLGVMYQLFYHYNYFQISNGLSIHYNRKTLGPPNSGFEMQSLLGCQFYWGDDAKYKKYMLSEYSLMSDSRYSAGFMYRYYLDQVETSQFTGGLCVNVDQFGIIFENDFLGIIDGFQDKYRTGSFGISYMHDSLLFTLQSTHWTGKAVDGTLNRNSDYPSKHGFRDLSNVKHGKYSHGILALRVDYLLLYNQTVRIESGIDAEQVRHAGQNGLVHDLLIPANRNNNGGNPHYPMLQENGSPYLYKEEQKVRKPKYYFQMGINPFMFY